MPGRKQIFSFISLLSIAVFIASFQTTSVSALSVDSQHFARDLHHHELAKKKRSTKQKRCKPRTAPSSAPASSPTSKTPAVTPAPAPAPAPSSSPATHSSAPAAPPPPPPAPKPTSSAPAKVSQSSSGSVQSFSSILPNKALLAWGADGSGLDAWTKMDAYYNWGPTSSGQGPPFIPMLWGTKNSDVWKSQVLTANPVPLAVKSLNEPELPGQGNLSPGDAAALWNECMLPLVGKTQVGAPAVTSDGGAIPWLQSFFASCNNGHPNCGATFMDYHFYGTDPQGLISAVENMHATFGMDIMISEFACQSFTGGQNCDQAQANEFASTVTDFFKSTDYVIGYAAFGAVSDIVNTGVAATNSLFNGNSESPNALAAIYYPQV